MRYVLEENDDLRAEYNLSSLKVRRVGKARVANYVQLDENDDLLPHYDFDYSKSKRIDSLKRTKKA